VAKRYSLASLGIFELYTVLASTKTVDGRGASTSHAARRHGVGVEDQLRRLGLELCEVDELL
jgi:hypothetical protein